MSSLHSRETLLLIEISHQFNVNSVKKTELI
jgi:hypothetical protein